MSRIVTGIRALVAVVLLVLAGSIPQAKSAAPIRSGGDNPYLHPQQIVNNKLVPLYQADAAPAPDLAHGVAMPVLLVSETQLWDTATHSWQAQGRISYTYDGMGRMLTYILQSASSGSLQNQAKLTFTYGTSFAQPTEEVNWYWTGTAWSAINKYIFTLNGSGLPTVQVTQSYISSAWVDKYRYNYAYDGSGNMTENTYQSWNGTAWVNGSQYLATYNGSGKINHFTNASWVSNAWVISSQTDITYDGNGYMNSYITQIRIGGTLTNTNKAVYTNNAAGHPTETITYRWSAGAWTESKKIVDVYDANGHMTSETNYDWDGSNWKESTRSTYTYNGSGKVTGELDQSWSGTAWTDQSRTTTEYDGAGNVTIVTNEQYFDGAWNNVYRVVNTWGTTAVGDAPAIASRFALAQNYPNPFNPSTEIHFSLSSASDVSLVIYDVLGREVARLAEGRMEVGDHALHWNAGSNPSGVYYYRLSAGNITQTRSMVLTK